MVETASDDPIYLPAQMDFDAPFDCLEEGTVYYDVDVTYPDCPDLNQNFDFFPGGEHSLEGICPVGAEISFRAMDGDGKVVGAGIYELGLAGGGNQVDLCPCWGKVDADFSGVASVPGVDEGAQLQLEVNYTDSSYPQATLDMDVSTLADRKGWSSMPGQAKVVQTLVDGAGNVLGYAEEEEVDLRCDANETSDLCFGWLTFTADKMPSETSSMVITGTSDHSWIEPSQVTMFPSGGADLGGLLVGDNVHVSAEALSATGEVLDVIEFDHALACGPNEVQLNFSTHELSIYANKTRAPASAFAYPYLFASFSKWDVDSTGALVETNLPGVEIHMSTDLGQLTVLQGETGPEVVGVSNENGTVLVKLISSEVGTATVNAWVEDPEVHAEPVTVEFLTPIRMVVDNTSESYDGYLLPDSVQAIRQYCVIQQKWTDGELDSESTDLEAKSYARIWPGHHVVGEKVNFVWIAGTGCPTNSAYSGPYISGSYLHYFFGEDYAHQKTVPLIENPLNLSGTFPSEVITLVDPTKPDPSPFDLSAPERFVLNGFR